MTQEEKELLLKDLSARLPYKVIVDYGHNAFDVHNGNYVKYGSKCILKCYLLDVFMSPRQNEKGEYIKPYLRPMSSMTEEEKKEYTSYVFEQPFLQKDKIVGLGSVPMCIDWLNKNMFDYRGLIECGLAIAVTEENNPYKE